MRAALYNEFAKPLTLETVPDPTPTAHGVVIRVEATGLCRSDWHGWMGHDPDIRLPHVPGHELAGVIEAVGSRVSRWQVGNRVTVPFVGGCGVCPECVSGQHQVCDQQFQPGFTHWGSFAQYVAIDYADANLVGLPEAIDFVTAASLGCRFATSFRAIVDQAKVSAGQWVAVHGCGGVGLSAIMIATSVGANVIAIDIRDDKLDFARTIGAAETINAGDVDDVVGEVQRMTRGGVDVSIDALGSPTTCFNSIANLRKRGKHIQVGLMLGDHKHPPVPMDKVIAGELEILGSHGMQAYRYPAMLAMIAAGKLHPEKLVGKTISLQESLEALPSMDRYHDVGVTVINPFG
ncbi:alcohol dehydrogenase zinc-binding domain protein [Rhodopirellula maiorica SM1]|uniref:Alcohol dehydrogenase zinc-binding domain protein n=1 Tax=Rhodopirellula maiorica SM1 TaxID=1265738 RepID=M5RBQ8_9BACT|nr:zinc-dependent alcohol dehydrogenase family protein [Rhodopirellula maiorica]EMI16800.1 alcohol dehydrogenase zinc-binding domain protein [Rhodopirellula maiorica SM1]